MRFIKENITTVTIHRTLVRDRRLSLSAKGLALFLAALPDDFDCTYKQLSEWNKNGVDSIKSAIIELRANGYLRSDDYTYFLNTNPSYDDLVKKVRIEKAQAQAKKNPEALVEKRKAERAEFIAKAKEAVKQMKPPQPNREQLQDFCDYWAGIDEFDPTKPLPYKSQKTFKMAARLRTSMRITKQHKKSNDDAL